MSYFEIWLERLLENRVARFLLGDVVLLSWGYFTAIAVLP